MTAAHLRGRKSQQGPHPCACAGLCQALRQSADVTLRQLAAVLIRKSLFEDEQHVWSRTSKEVQGVVKAELLNAVQNEQNDQIRRMVCCVSVMCLAL